MAVTAGKREGLIAVGLVVLVALLAHGLLLAGLGFYFDDWYFHWLGWSQDRSALIADLKLDRPGIGYFYAALFPVLGSHPLRWQLYFLALHLLGALMLLAGLRRLWPGQRFLTLSVALLFVVYPGFLQQPLALVYSAATTALTLSLISLAASLYAATASGRRAALGFTLLAALALLGALALVPDYVLGIEVLRCLLLITVAQRAGGARRDVLRRFLRLAWPYGAAVLLFALWRVLFFTNPGRADTDLGWVASAYRTNPLLNARRLALESVRDFLESVVFGWFATANHRLLSAPILGASRKIAQALAVGTAAGLLVLAYARWLGRRADPPDEGEQTRLGRRLLIIGALGVWGGLLPVLLVFRDIRLLGFEDRYLFPVLAAVSVTVGGAIAFAVRPPLRAWVVAGLVVLSTATHFSNLQGYQVDWQRQRQLWWQLAWRVPDLQASTLLILDVPAGYSDFPSWQILGAANLLYGGQGPARVYGVQLNDGTRARLERGMQQPYQVRSTGLTLDYRQAIVAAMPGAASCVYVLDAAHPLEIPPHATSLLRLAVADARTDAILPDAAPRTPPAAPFGAEPAHDWCYYFEKAGLARQQGDWAEVVRLGDEAQQRGLAPQEAARAEWLPFVDGYARAGRCDRVRELLALIRPTLSILDQPRLAAPEHCPDAGTP